LKSCLTFLVIALTLAQPRTSDFSHTTHVGKEKLACGSCHKVVGKDVADFPEHTSCLNCHRQQFFARERPGPKICSNCHVKATPNDTSRHPFPSLGKKPAGFVSEFRIHFAHHKHEDVTCVDCHKTKEPEDKPHSLTHANCFVCHNQESELAPLPASCDTCHALAASEKRAGVQRAHAAPQQQNYSQFKHDNGNHARLPCLLCHRRENNSAQPTFPGKAAHAPCTGCHAQQFSNPASEICTICHTDAQSGKVKAFPPLRSFDARFDHAKHSGAACATCHRRNRGGFGLSIPSRLNAHVTCFSCHTPGAQANGKNISSCSTCHQLGRLVRTSEQASAYRAGFSHARHDASCAVCHQVRAGLPKGRQVSAPLPLNHHAPARAFSCASCHNGQRTFGGDDFSVCTRCHKGPSWRF
jgi:Cytochrome c7 and related cytochrome c